MEQQHIGLLLVGFLILSTGLLMNDTVVKNRHVCEGGAMDGQVVYDESECDVIGEYVGREEVDNDMKGLTIVAGSVLMLVGGVLAFGGDDSEDSE